MPLSILGSKTSMFLSLQYCCHLLRYVWYCLEVPSRHEAISTSFTHCDKIILVQSLLDKRQTRKLNLCHIGWVSLGWLGNWSRSLPASRCTGFPLSNWRAAGYHACVGPYGDVVFRLWMRPISSCGHPRRFSPQPVREASVVIWCWGCGWFITLAVQLRHFWSRIVIQI